jgi:benzil reductase ((S)-benzoin forming)
MKVANNNRELIIINGCTRGLGLSIVHQILKLDKFNILCLVRDENTLGDLSDFKDRIDIQECDYSNPDRVNEIGGFFKIYLKDYNEDVFFINNLSIVTPIGAIGYLTTKDISESINVNVLSNLLVINHLMHIKEVNILNISSGISQNPICGLGLYGIAKSYSDYLMNVLIKENKKLKIASFYPGGMNTAMQNTLQDNLKNSKSLVQHDYSNIYNQKLYDIDYVAQIIVQNFFFKNNGWKKKVSRIYDYE